MINSMLTKDPVKRPSAEDLLKMDYCKSVLDNEESLRDGFIEWLVCLEWTPAYSSLLSQLVC